MDITKALKFSLVVLTLAGCCRNKKFDYLKITGYTQGSTYQITYENSIGNDLKAQIDSILKVIDFSLSVYNPESIISSINANDPSIETNDLFRTVFEKSLEVYKNSGGAFDITVAPLVNAWGFGPKGHKTADKKTITTLLQYVGMDKVKITGKKLMKKFPEVNIDMNAIAQGFSVDLVCKFLDSLNIQNYVVEIAGEVRAKGKNQKGEIWKVGIDKPVEGNEVPGEHVQAILQLNNKAVATSGDYRKYYIENGIKYAHHIDPHTGYPARQNLLSASIIAHDCITADAYGTACMVMGLEKSKSFLTKHPELDAYLIYSNNKGQFCDYLTEGVKKIITH